jgi:hypothetical protein
MECRPCALGIQVSLRWQHAAHASSYGRCRFRRRANRLRIETMALLHNLKRVHESKSLTETEVHEKRGCRQLRLYPPSRAGHGNDRVWKAWKAIRPVSHPSHTPWKSLRDYHIPTASTTREGFRSKNKDPSHKPKLKPYRCKGLVTDVSGPRCNACPGTLIPPEGLVIRALTA